MARLIDERSATGVPITLDQDNDRLILTIDGDVVFDGPDTKENGEAWLSLYRDAHQKVAVPKKKAKVNYGE